MTIISDTAGQATEQLKDTASHARTAFIELAAQAMKLFNNVREAEGRGVETVLDRLGLQRRQSAAVPALWFAAGAVTAGAAVLMLAPTSGKQLRERIASFLEGEADQMAAKAKTMEQRVEETVRTEAAPVRKMPNGVKSEIGR